jgi:hypothetical protein
MRQSTFGPLNEWRRLRQFFGGACRVLRFVAEKWRLMYTSVDAILSHFPSHDTVPINSHEISITDSIEAV